MKTDREDHMTYQTMLIPPGWGEVAAHALRHGRADLLEALRAMDLELAEETFEAQYGWPIEDVPELGPCWVEGDGGLYMCGRDACAQRTGDDEYFRCFDRAHEREPWRESRDAAIAAGLLRADLQRLADLDREEGTHG